MAASFPQTAYSYLEKSKGQLFAIAAGISIALNAAFTKDLNLRNKVSFVIVGRSLAQIIFCFICAVITKSGLIPREKSEMVFFILRTFANSLLTILVAIAYSLLPILDTMAIHLYVSIIIQLVVARFKLKEKIDSFTAFILFTLLSGIIMLCQPTFLFGSHAQESSKGSSHLFGYMVASIGGFFQAIATLSARVMPKTDSNIIALYGGFTSLIMALIYSTFNEGPSLSLHARDYGFMAIAGFSYAAFVWTETLSLKTLYIAKFQTFALIELPISFLMDIFWFKDVPNVLGYFGATTIILSIAVKSVRDVYKFKRKENEEMESVRLVGAQDSNEQDDGE